MLSTAKDTIGVSGAVCKGVGFHSFKYRLRLTCANGLNGCVLNAGGGMKIHLEGEKERVLSSVVELGETG